MPESDPARARVAPELPRSHRLLIAAELGELYSDLVRETLPADWGQFATALREADFFLGGTRCRNCGGLVRNAPHLGLGAAICVPCAAEDE